MSKFSSTIRLSIFIFLILAPQVLTVESQSVLAALDSQTQTPTI